MTTLARAGSIRRCAGAAAALGAVALVALSPSGQAHAHPLGNFSVSHLSRITLEAESIRLDVVVDSAEIPTAQDRSAVDTDGDGTVGDDERSAYAQAECNAFVDAATISLGGETLPADTVQRSFSYEPGQAGLETSRLECSYDLSVPDGYGDTNATLDYTDGYRPGRVGWREINAVAAEVGIVDSSVPPSSVTDGLRTYPEELLESPLDVTSVSLRIGPDGQLTAPDLIAPIDADPGDEPSDDGVDTDLDPDEDTAADARDSLVAARPGFLGSFVDGVQDRFDELIGTEDITVGVGVLAIGLSLLLGASHALLPGHGKTVMAAYIAGRQGQARDAVLVGATVTLTHTGGVLLLGLGLSISTALAGETVLSWLGVASGLLIAALGLALLVSAVRRRDSGWLVGGHHHHGPGGHTHGPDGTVHHHDHSHHGDHDHDHDHGDHGDGDHDHDHDHGDHGDGDHAHGDHDHDHDHDHGDHAHDHGHGHGDHDHDHHAQAPERVSRGGLVGMGVAGGLVPSPSALIVLLSAIALGRTWFGVVLVLAYGVGMAVILTLAGIALVRVRDRLQRRFSSIDGRASRAAQRWGRLVPFFTAALVFVVGAGLAIRSFTTL